MQDQNNKNLDNNLKPKCYVLDMFPYPSGEGLHVGHPKGYIATDVYSRYKEFLGYEIVHPMGWDAFGLPAEQFALKHKIHPRVAVEKNIANFKSQLNKIHFNYDWKREISTTDPKFYKWTQWIFKQMFKKGLAFQSSEPINWCPSCKTGLANEDLDGNKCERCDSVVEKRPLRQWNLAITKYADRLIDDLDTLEKWPEWVKTAQKNWIGRSEGVKYKLQVKDMDLEVETFSTHFEAFYADRFAVIAPDHKLLPVLVKGLENENEILNKAKEISDKKTSNKYEDTKDYEGVFTGRYLVDPITGCELPLWVSSYALSDYGTGIVKCSCHDERDFNFAKKYNLPMYAVLFTGNKEEDKKIENFEYCYNDFKNGILKEPKELMGKVISESRIDAFDYLVSRGFAEKTKAYKLRDWVFARQRYWGEPFPIVFATDENGKTDYDKPYVVADSELPIFLPNVESYEPTGTGESPLANIKEFTDVYGFINEEGEFVSCDKEEAKAKLFKRETNTMPQWAGSSWYWLRFLDSHNDNFLIDPFIEKAWPQVDVYVGGDHATRHLIYARFWHKFLHDIGVVSTIEPFARLEFLGFILAEDGRKMSKRWGNIINPDDIVAEYGADTLRVYEMFMAPFEATAAWSTENIKGSKRFLDRVERLKDKMTEPCKNQNIIHQTVKKVGEDIEGFKFNTAISQMMIALNEFEQNGISKDEYQKLLTILNPFAPIITENILKEVFGIEDTKSLSWPAYDETKLSSDVVNIAVQIGGKMRGVIETKRDLEDTEIEGMFKNSDIYKKYIESENKEIKKIIIVKNKIINVVI